MAMECEWHKQNGNEVRWGCGVWGKEEIDIWADKVITEPEGLPFLSLPKPDRVFTRAMDYAYDNGNFKYTPGTYIQAASSCWWGRCTFCVEKDKPYIVREVADVIDEIRECKEQRYREIFDDSGTFPIGRWLDDFIRQIKKENIHRSVYLGCNMRLVNIDYAAMKSANFRMLLFGVESASQDTLDRINKGVKVEDIKYIKKAAEAGLEPHIAVMFGYPWESEKDGENTLRLVWDLLRRGYAKTAQASFYHPKDGSVCYENRKFVSRIYEAAWSFRFWLNKITDIKNTDDLKYLWRSIKKGVGI